MSVMTDRASELDVATARLRLAATAEEAKRLEEAGEGFAALEAWKRYELIANAIAAQERRQRARAGGS